jgi:radical SAM superfamily enzyme YgiQ (UPF0313 family)
MPNRRKLLIMMPDGRIHKLKLGAINKSFREAPLTATALAALVPEELDFDIRIVDESIDQVPTEEHFDLVAISCLTGTVVRAYHYADHFRSKGIPVVLGGVHVTLMPEEAALHADAIVTGFAETTWPGLLRDFVNGQMKPLYSQTEQHFYNVPIPRRDLQRKSGYMVPNVVSATRGCKGVCDFCSVSAAHFGWSTRPVPEVINEVKNLPSSRFVFNDVSMGEDMDYFKELMKALIPLRKKWGGLVSTKVFRDPEVLPLLRKSGCIYLLLGFESLNNESLQNISKGFNKFEEYKYIIDSMRQNDIVLMACFIFGFDEDNKEIFQKTVDFVNDYKIDIPRYAIYTPYPKTEAFEKLKAEGRLLHYHWQHYDTQHVVFRPRQMTPEELDRGFIWSYKKTFTIASSLRRTINTGINFPLTFGGNLAYNIYIRRLMNEKNRILYDSKTDKTDS